MSFRVIISALVVGAISIGNTLQAAMSGTTEITRWQIYSAVIGGIVLMLNDIKSRLTPPETPAPPKQPDAHIIVQS